MGKIHRKKEFALSIIMLALSAFVCFNDSVVINMPALNRGGYFARADVYLKFWAVLLAVISFVILIRSFRAYPEGEEVSQKFLITPTIVITSIGLVLYVILLPIIGFFISTFALTFLLSILYTVKEENKSIKDYEKPELIKKLVRSVIYSVIMVFVLWLIFAKGLTVQLP